MKVIKRTCLTAAVTLLAAVLCLLVTGLVLAACSEKVTLRFVTNGGTEVESVEGAAGTAYRAPSDPEKEGYFFDGWYLQSDFSGEKQDLPEKMPAKSTTYYAKYVKYAALHLDPAGGTLEACDHTLKPDTKLSDYLKDYIPQKEGLLFGGWMKDGEMLSQNALMPEGELYLTARYQANFSVNVYVQDPDSPENFIKSEEWSKTGADWEGKQLKPALCDDQHLFLDPSREVSFSTILGAGENVLDFYYLRENVSVCYNIVMPSGEQREKEDEFLYGAHISLWEGPETKNERILYGWAESEQDRAKYMPEEAVTLGADDMVLYGTWAKKYSGAKAGGYFAVEEISEGTKHGASYVFEDGTRLRGLFDEESGFFEGEKGGGKLDNRGYFLLDDSGSYSGYDLAENKASEEKFGALELDFKKGTARFTIDGETVAGSYDLLFDDVTGRYTGVYRFSSAGGEKFDFALDETQKTFRREGHEKGGFTLLSDGKFDTFSYLELDGFGNAVLKDMGNKIEGTYLGAGAKNEWLFRSEEKNFRFLAGTQDFTAGDFVCQTKAYMIYSDELYGNFQGLGSLRLDGYGLVGEYLSPGGQTFSGSFSREGNFIILYAAQTMKFTLQGANFALTGEEAGTYLGEKGTLFLDGGGRATLEEAGGTREGLYVKNGDKDFTFRVEGEEIRLKLFDGEYKVYDPALLGSYTTRYGGKLRLDGFGGGLYTTEEGLEIAVSVGYHEAAFLELTSPSWSVAHYFKLFSDSVMSQPSDPYFGVYRVYEDGNYSGTLLILDENGSGRLRVEDVSKSGTFSQITRSEIKFLSSGEEIRFRLTEKNGRAAAIRYEGAGVYTGLGTLDFDGFETATYTTATSKEEGRCVLSNGYAELYTDGGLWRLTLSGAEIGAAAYFEGYAGEKGELFLEKNGKTALLRGETDSNGSFETLEGRTGSYLLFRGGETFSFRLFQNTYKIYDESREKSYTCTGGGTFELDGCGGAVFARGEIRAAGDAEYSDGIILFRSNNLASANGVRAFKINENGTATLLGAEYGKYVAGRETLTLDGEGGAVFCGITGVYRAESNDEFLFTGGGLSFAFRLSESNFLKKSEALAALSGNYETDRGTLTVTGFGAVLTKADNSRETLSLVLAAEHNLFLQDQNGAIWRFDLETKIVTPASGGFTAGT